MRQLRSGSIKSGLISNSNVFLGLSLLELGHHEQSEDVTAFYFCADSGKLRSQIGVSARYRAEQGTAIGMAGMLV